MQVFSYLGGFPLPIRSTRSSRSPKFPDRTWLISTKRGIHDFFLNSSRSQTLDYPELYAIFTRSQLDQLDLCSSAARSGCDRIITRVKVGMTGYRSGTYRVRKVKPDQIRSLYEWFSINSIFYSTNTRSLLDRLTRRSSKSFLFVLVNRNFSNIFAKKLGYQTGKK